MSRLSKTYPYVLAELLERIKKSESERIYADSNFGKRLLLELLRRGPSDQSQACKKEGIPFEIAIEQIHWRRFEVQVCNADQPFTEGTHALFRLTMMSSEVIAQIRPNHPNRPNLLLGVVLSQNRFDTENQPSWYYWVLASWENWSLLWTNS